eukprot:c15266_g1_i1.p1 GENE.c15266_g1_i1~~c15266_g1_i1.p1  ORF type:complete len:552 (-),score=249.12 c15266_g1_i1:20-1630(-)
METEEEQFNDHNFWRVPMRFFDDEEDQKNVKSNTKPVVQAQASNNVAPKRAQMKVDYKNEKTGKTGKTTVVGDLTCQLDSFKKELLTKVISCAPVLPEKAEKAEKAGGKEKKESEKKENEKKESEDGKKKNKKKGQQDKPEKQEKPQKQEKVEEVFVPDLYEVVLEDTILFPTGGGQPNDLGSIDGVDVVDVQRKGNVCVHFTKTKVTEGKEVLVKLDWNRRHDHMQQHSGQHVLSSVFEKKHSLKTVSWELSQEKSNIELDTPETLTQEQLDEVENIVNGYIADGLPVNVVHLDSKNESEKLRGSKVPATEGPVRLITIEQGVDSCTCCGTHVTNTSQLQLCKILGTEKKRGRLCVWFIFGNRALKTFSQCLQREVQLTSILNTAPAQYFDIVSKMQNTNKNLLRDNKNLYTEIAQSQAKALVAKVQGNKKLKGVAFHREVASAEYLSEFTSQFNSKVSAVVLCLVIGEYGKEGTVYLSGPNDRVEKLAPEVAKLLGCGKGGGPAGKYQAPVTKLPKNAEEANTLLNSVESVISA